MIKATKFASYMLDMYSINLGILFNDATSTAGMLLHVTVVGLVYATNG
jgi:hypothetical protein